MAPDRHATAAHTSSSSIRLMLESAAFTLAMSARATSTPAGVGPWAHLGLLSNDFVPRATEFALT